MTQREEAIVAVAAAHGLGVDPQSVVINDIGLDFQVAFARTRDGVDWVLRLPRRPDVVQKAKLEARILELVKTRLPVAVPDWKVHTDRLIAYPLLPGKPGMTVDAKTYEVTWNFDQKSPEYGHSLARLLVSLHGIDHGAARAAGVPVLTPTDVRARHQEKMARVRQELGVAETLWSRWQVWLNDDSYWPSFSCFTHGELYPAHTIVDGQGTITGVIDWTEAVVGDPAAEFVMQLVAFGEEGFDQLVSQYRELGGRIWPRLKEHCQELFAAGPANYGIYALTTGEEQHLKTAKIQLGVATE